MAQIMNEAFDLAFGLRPVGTAQPRDEAMVVGEVAEPRLKPILARTVGLPPNHHGGLQDRLSSPSQGKNAGGAPDEIAGLARNA